MSIKENPKMATRPLLPGMSGHPTLDERPIIWVQQSKQMRTKSLVPLKWWYFEQQQEHKPLGNSGVSCTKNCLSQLQ